ncbi:hypothetical protein SAMN04489760_1503 [Syntrophus gentianae]|uniref:Uncharacterized protein n=1 Tax=Syntrophus gentianae TaxID=43775 RepID=A0A1H8BER4_9BACT|nr:hypothetical protein [Syntrophus gentianae]SEM80347.1 hypothetical protein SAMN04489760_1503 [Syntrophus gentianae]
MENCIRKINAIIREQACGISLPHSEAFDALWKQNEIFLKELLFDLAAHMEPFRTKGGLYKDKIEASRKFRDAILGKEEKRYPPEPLSDAQEEDKETLESIYFGVEGFLAEDYAPPKDCINSLQVHLLCLSILYGDIIPRMDAVYPIINMKLDNAKSRLAMNVGVTIGVSWNVGKKHDSAMKGVEEKRKNAQRKTDDIQDILNELSSEQNKKKIAELRGKAMSKTGLSEQSVKKREKNLMKKISDSIS